MMNPTYDFSGQVALVTGASSGMGLATAQAYAESGAAVVLTDVNETALQAATDDLTAAGHQVIGTIATPMVTDMIDKGELDLDVAKANQPINRLGTPEEIAASVPWLTSPGAGFVIGVALPVDGGYTAQ